MLMRSDMLEKTIAEMNESLVPFASMDCIAVWRSVGSNIFFEFGMPIITRVEPKTRKAFTAVYGEVSIGIHADDWSLRVDRREIAASDTFSDSDLSEVAKRFRGLHMPKFGVSWSGLLALMFDNSISVSIGQNDYPDDTSPLEDEVTINSSELGFRFNYRRGFYLAS